MLHWSMNRRQFLTWGVACVASPSVSSLFKRSIKRAVPSFPQIKVVASKECWGVLRDVSSLASGGVTGTWGVARDIPGHGPLNAPLFGAPRPFLVETDEFLGGYPAPKSSVLLHQS